jgi:hypothetical protein
MDRGGVADRRRRLLAGLSGRVLEVGAGNGLNIRQYAAGVTDVRAEPQPLLRQSAVREAEQAPSAVEAGDTEPRQAGASVGKTAWAKAVTYFNGAAT